MAGFKLSKRCVDITGQRFGSLVAEYPTGYDEARHHVMWFCRCDCGGSTVARGAILRSGLTKACGGHRPRTAIGNTALGRRLYPRYHAMVERTTKEYSHAWKSYGARGIRVCDRWLGPDGFLNFLADMGPTFQAGMQIDRVNNDGNYEPGNCRWTTPSRNSRNRRSTRMLTHNGVTQSLTDWAEWLGVKASTLGLRLRSGWPVDRALTTPVPSPRRLR